MALNNIQPPKDSSEKLHSKYLKLQDLFIEIEKKELTPKVEEKLNEVIASLNAFDGKEKQQLKQVRRAQSKALNIVLKDLKLVTPNYYRNLWLGVGMAVFGIPMGTALGLAVDNLGLLGVGLPLGLTIGYAVGAEMDKKAKNEGKVLDVNIEY